ncbi:hypothetical protein AGMMS49942_26520 [Spirochaetia bacterium]|nr:hypothetical protein AGMMS49942_26520 [Spirochaetia bacterium]
MGIFAPRIIALFRSDDPELIAMPFLGWVMICNMMTQTMGRARIASLLAFVRQGLFPVLFLLIFPRLITSFFFSIPFMITIVRKELKDHSGKQYGKIRLSIGHDCPERFTHDDFKTGIT